MKVIYLLIYLFLLVMLFIFLATSLQSKAKVWVRGESGKYCYDEFKYHKNIKHFRSFNSEEECLQSINR